MVWCVGIDGPCAPMTVPPPKEAVGLVVALRDAGEYELASDVLRAAERAIKANETGQP
jgi:Arc/MetJ-type ribon-helix-helix transcriptional regulator